MKKIKMMFLISFFLLVPSYVIASDLERLRFSFIRGEVQVRTEDTDDWVPASINMPLREGDRIWVPEEGMAELQAKDGSYLRLADRSGLEILTLDRDSYQTYLTEGRLYANFRGSRDGLLQIDTPTSSVSAYGKSTFNVEVPETGPVNVSAFRGAVTVENRDGRIEVKEGESLSLGEGTVSEKSTLDSPDDWERWNRERDRDTAERRPPAPHLPEELQPYSNDFYSHGRWVYTPDYGYAWTPTVSVTVGWAPYRSGRWVWIRGDYVWVSYEPWGWVPYHYGRWFFGASIGWCWVPPARGAVYWGPGYVGWVYTSRHVAWVPLAPREVYYGRGHHGPHSVNMTNVNVTNIHVDKVVYKNVKVHNAVTTVHHDTFVRGKPAEARVKDNPFLTERIHVGGPPIKPEKASMMPVVREVPHTKRPPEPIRNVNVKGLKAERPMGKGREASVFAPETQPREMPVKTGEAKPLETKAERTKELRQPSRRPAEPGPSAQSEKRAGQPGATQTNVQTRKEPSKSERTLERAKQLKPGPAEAQEQKQPGGAGKGSSQPVASEPSVRTPEERKTPERGIEKTGQNRSTSLEEQEKGKGRPSSRGNSQPAPSAPAFGALKGTRTPERGMDKRMESRATEKAVGSPRPPERVQGKNKEVSPPERATQQAAKFRTPEKRMEQPRESRNLGKVASSNMSFAASGLKGLGKRN